MSGRNATSSTDLLLVTSNTETVDPLEDTLQREVAQERPVAGRRPARRPPATIPAVKRGRADRLRGRLIVVVIGRVTRKGLELLDAKRRLGIVAPVVASVVPVVAGRPPAPEGQTPRRPPLVGRAQPTPTPPSAGLVPALGQGLVVVPLLGAHGRAGLEVVLVSKLVVRPDEPVQATVTAAAGPVLAGKDADDGDSLVVILADAVGRPRRPRLEGLATVEDPAVFAILRLLH